MKNATRTYRCRPTFNGKVQEHSQEITLTVFDDDSVEAHNRFGQVRIVSLTNSLSPAEGYLESLIRDAARQGVEALRQHTDHDVQEVETK